MVEFGESALVTLGVISLFQAILPFFYKRFLSFQQFKLSQMSQYFQTALVLFSFFSLIYAYVVTDLSIFNVALNTHHEAALLYKITGVWGNHEGSMMLWLVILVLYGTSLAVLAPRFFINFAFCVRALSVQSFLVFLITFFILYTSNPFIKTLVPFLMGRDLNPILQDPALALHPPILYLGLIGFSIPFSFSVASLWEASPRLYWLRAGRAWTLFSWSCLTIGIALGSWWAYYELGWGGWWFWDPVENASLMPWLAGTALLHLFKVVKAKQKLIRWCYLLSLVCFLLSLFSTLLVRSGLLSSVHAFSQDPKRGIVLSLIFAAICIGTCSLFFIRWKGLESTTSENSWFSFTDRAGMILLNNHFLMTLLGTLLLSILYPLIFESLTGQKVTIGPPYFMMTFIPLSLFLLIGMGLSGWTTWTREGWREDRHYLWLPMTLSLCVFLYLLVFYPQFGLREGGAILVIIISSWIIFSTVRGFFSLSYQSISMTFAHIGLAISLLGMAIDTLGVEEKLIGLKVGEKTDFQGYEVHLRSIDYAQYPTYQVEQAALEFHRAGEKFFLAPEKRYYPAHQVLTTEVALAHHWFSNMYVALGNVLSGEQWTIRLYYHPWVELIWLGGGIMALGGFMGLASRFNRQFLRNLRRKRTLSIIVIWCLSVSFFSLHISSAGAIEVGEHLSDPLLEQRARDLSATLKCPVCIGQSIDDSQAPLAEDLRLQVRTLLAQGLREEEICHILEQKYGEQIFFKPSFKPAHLILWLLPFALSIGGALLLYLQSRNIKKSR